MTAQPPSLVQIEAKCIGAISGLEKMREIHKSNVLEGVFGDDYNRTRQLILKAIPDVESLLPPETRLQNGRLGRTQTTPAELLAYYHQLRELVRTHISQTSGHGR